MTPDLLMKHFDRIIEAPDAIPRMRRFILDLAVRGKLVEQDPDDEPASELLKRIAKEKSQLVSDGKLPYSKPSSRPRADELTFELKPGWESVRFNQILIEIQTGPFGSSLHQSDYERNGIPVINPASIKDERLHPIESMAVGPATLERLATFKLLVGDIVMGRRGEMGRCAVVTDREEGWLCGTGSLILRLSASVFSRFVVTLLGSPLVRQYLSGSAVGATMQNLNQSILLNLIIGLPPLAEQYRIVAKVNELMALCDRLEAAQSERERWRDSLVASSLHRINDDSCADGFREDVSFFLRHLPLLTTSDEHFHQFRRCILDLAVKGRLVSQDPTDESASALIGCVKAEKARLEAGGGIRKEKPLPEVAPIEIPFAIPTNWLWARIGTLSVLTEYGTSVKSDRVEDGIPILKMGDIQGGEVLLNPRNRVPQDIEDLPKLFLKRLDLLYNRTNSAELVGKTGIYLGDDDAYTFASYLIRIRLFNDLISPAYINLAMNAPYFRKTQIAPQLQQQCGQANVNGSKLRNMVIPIPPFAEQLRIVTRVNEVIGLCNRLQERIAVSRSEGSRFLESILNVALAKELSIICDDSFTPEQ